MDEILAGVVAEACSKDPSLPAEVAAQLAAVALRLPHAAEATEIARALLADNSELDVSWVNAVATAVVGPR